MKTIDKTWPESLAESLLHSFQGPVPDDVLERAALQVLDSVACAAGAQGSDPVEIVHRVIRGSGPQQATLLFRGERASLVDAVLANGTAVRYLDANDVFLGTGPGGHPSDNIPVALAVGEHRGASGEDVLKAIALSYELTTRLRTEVIRRTAQGGRWDGVSLSATVGAVAAALLMGCDVSQLANAIGIGAAKGYALKEIRHGEISMLKASGNAVVARDGVLAAMLAMEGYTGSPAVFEGEWGLVRTLGGEPDPDILEQLCAPPAWSIRDISIKPYPAIGTSQSAVCGAVTVSAEDGFNPRDVARVTIRLPDTKYTRQYVEIPERMTPRSRESADHSIPFLVALALEEGGVTGEHFDQQCWTRDSTRSLMERTVIEADADLAKRAKKAFPAVVEVTMQDGRSFAAEVIDTPGSPASPWGRDEICDKFRRLQRAGLSAAAIDKIADASVDLVTAPDLTQLLDLVRDRG